MSTQPNEKCPPAEPAIEIEQQVQPEASASYTQLRRLAAECRDLTPREWPARHATVWIDTEFNGYGGELISLAMVDENDHQFYEAVACENPQPWVAENVLPVLGTRPRSLGWLQRHLHWWLSAYDSVHIVADWPDDVAYFCRALITGPGERMNTPALTFEIRRDLDAVSAIPHNALEDAKAMRARHLQIMGPGPRRTPPWPAEGTLHNGPAARAGGLRLGAIAEAMGVADEYAMAAASGLAATAADRREQLRRQLTAVGIVAAGTETSDTGSAGVESASGASCAAAERPGQPGGAFFAGDCAHGTCPHHCTRSCADLKGDL